MSDYRDARKDGILTDTESDSENSASEHEISVTKRNGKRKIRIQYSESDSSVEQRRKIRKIPRVTSDSEESIANFLEIVQTKRAAARLVSDDSNDSDSVTELSGALDNGFENNSSNEWESDWISVSEFDEQSQLANASRIDAPVALPVASTSVNNEYFSDSSDSDAEKCPICLLSFTNQEVGTLDTCDHNFCADCIQEWSKIANTCPVDRQTFTLISVRKRYNGKVIRQSPVDVRVRRSSVDELIQEDRTYCEICGMSDREDRLLLCYCCNLGYHLECLDPPLDAVPIEEWYCSDCRFAAERIERASVTR